MREVLNALMRTEWVGGGAQGHGDDSACLFPGQLREGTSWAILAAQPLPSVLLPIYMYLLLPTWSILGEEQRLALFSTDFGGSGESGSHGGSRPCVYTMRTEASEVQQRAG